MSSRSPVLFLIGVGTRLHSFLESKFSPIDANHAVSLPLMPGNGLGMFNYVGYI